MAFAWSTGQARSRIRNYQDNGFEPLIGQAELPGDAGSCRSLDRETLVGSLHHIPNGRAGWSGLGIAVGCSPWVVGTVIVARIWNEPKVTLLSHLSTSRLNASRSCTDIRDLIDRTSG